MSVSSTSSESVENECLREDGTPFPGREHPSMIALGTGKCVAGVVMGVLNPREKAYRWINISAVPVLKPPGAPASASRGTNWILCATPPDRRPLFTAASSRSSNRCRSITGYDSIRSRGTPQREKNISRYQDSRGFCRNVSGKNHADARETFLETPASAILYHPQNQELDLRWKSRN